MKEARNLCNIIFFTHFDFVCILLHWEKTTMWCVAWFATILYILKNVKNTDGGVSLSVKLQVCPPTEECHF